MLFRDVADFNLRYHQLCHRVVAVGGITLMGEGTCLISQWTKIYYYCNVNTLTESVSTVNLRLGEKRQQTVLYSVNV